MRIVACDDEKTVLLELSKLISPKLMMGDLFDCVTTGTELMELQAKAPIDVLLLDIWLPGMNGIELAEELRSICRNTRIVYLTKDPGFALDAFGVQAYDYLVKPVKTSRLFDVLDRARGSLLGKRRGTLRIKTCEGVIFEDVENILFIESFRNNLKVHTPKTAHECIRSLGDVEAELSEKGFCRVHKSFLVNLSFVKRVDERGIWLDSSTRIPIGCTRTKESIFLALGEWRGRA